MKAKIRLIIETRRQSYVVEASHPAYDEIKDALSRGDTGGAYKAWRYTKAIAVVPKKKSNTPSIAPSKRVVKAAPEVATPKKKAKAKAKAKTKVYEAEVKAESSPETNPKAKYIVSSDGVWFATRKANYTVRKDHPFFVEIRDALSRGDTGGAYRLYMKKSRGETRLEVKGDELKFDGMVFAPAFAEAYANAKANGAGYAALEAFFENLAKNVNPISVEAFTAFLAETKMPITDRGTFLAYRRCSSKYRDHHTGKFSNIPGSVCRMARDRCDSVQTRTCSTGFHVCSYKYLNNFSAGPDLVVEINPRDVVAVPPDYNLSKMRVSSMRILCGLAQFREKTNNHKFDCLTSIPFFAASQADNWDVLTGIDKVVIEENKHLANGELMTADEWLALEPI